MKKMLFLLIILILGTNTVYAECSSDEINRLKELAENITVEYNYAPDAFFEEDGIIVELTGVFETKILGLFEGVYIYDEEYDIEYRYEDIVDGVISLGYLYGGKHSYEIYSDSCGKIDNLEFRIPKYNQYYNDPLCEGIDGNELSICSEWYDTDVDYDTFKKMIQNYKNNKVTPQIDDDTSIIDTIVDWYDKYIKDYVIYIVLAVIIIVLLTVGIIIHRKRSVLE